MGKQIRIIIGLFLLTGTFGCALFKKQAHPVENPSRLVVNQTYHINEAKIEALLNVACSNSYVHLVQKPLGDNLDSKVYLWDLRMAVDQGEIDPVIAGRKSGNWPLLIFAWNGDFEYVRKLLLAGADPNVNDGDGRGAYSVLHYCAQYDHPEVAACLIRHGANVNIKNKSGYPPLIQACMYRHSDMIALLAEAKADFNMQCQLGTPLFYVMQDSEILKQLIDLGADVNLRATNSDTPLIAASHGGNLQCFRLLLDAGAKMDATNRLGRSALLEALANGHADIAEALLDAGADWRGKDAAGNSAIVYAANLPSLDLVDRLAKLGADTNEIHLCDLDLLKVKNSVRRWAYAVTAAQMIHEHIPRKHLAGYQPYRERGDLGTKLATFWGIYSREQAQEALDKLEASSVSDEFADIAKSVANLPEAKFQQEQDDLLLSDPHLRMQREVVRKYLAQGVKGDLLGWETARYIHLLQLCGCLGYLDMQEVWRRITPRLKPLQDRFTSWQEFSANVRVGNAFTGSSHLKEYDFIDQMLLNPADTNSPWNQISWQTALDSTNTMPPIEKKSPDKN